MLLCYVLYIDFQKNILVNQNQVKALKSGGER